MEHNHPIWSQYYHRKFWFHHGKWLFYHGKLAFYDGFLLLGMSHEAGPCNRLQAHGVGLRIRWLGIPSHQPGFTLIMVGDTVIPIENGGYPIEIVDLPIENSKSFHSYGTVYQRVKGFYRLNFCLCPFCLHQSFPPRWRLHFGPAKWTLPPVFSYLPAQLFVLKMRDLSLVIIKSVS